MGEGPSSFVRGQQEYGIKQGVDVIRKAMSGYEPDTKKEIKELKAKRDELTNKINKLEAPYLDKKKARQQRKFDDFELMCKAYNAVHKKIQWGCDNPYYVKKYGNHIDLCSPWMNGRGQDFVDTEDVTTWSRPKFFKWIFRHIAFSNLIKRGWVSISDLYKSLNIEVTND